MINDGGLLNTVLSNFTDAISGAWGPSLSGYLLPLLMALVCLQFGMVAIEAAIGRDIPLVIAHVMLGIIRVSIAIAIFQHAFDWGNAIVQTFQQVGQNISGFGGQPSEVFNIGGAMAQTIFNAQANGSWYIEIIQSLEFLFTGIAVLACWATASLIYLGCLIEVALIVYAGPLIICVTPLRWTFDMLIVWARSLLSIGFKVALILMTLAVGTLLANQWAAEVAAAGPTLTTNLWNLLVAIVESALFVFCVWKVPNRLSGLAPGAAILGFGEAVSSMAAGAAGSVLHSTLGGGSSSHATSSGGAGGGGSSEGWGSQAASALRDTAKALANKVQTKLTM